MVLLVRFELTHNARFELGPSTNWGIEANLVPATGIEPAASSRFKQDRFAYLRTRA